MFAHQRDRLIELAALDRLEQAQMLGVGLRKLHMLKAVAAHNRAHFIRDRRIHLNQQLVLRALDDGGPRVAHPALVRPWLQAFFYNADQVLAGINEAEARGHGWMLWNAGGEYARSWLPPLEDGDG